MNKRKTIAIIFLGIAITLGVIFYSNIDFPVGFDTYFKKSYYSQLGAIAICIELFVAGYYVFRGNKKANFTLALFGFTTLLDIIFDVTSLVSSNVPVYGMVIFLLLVRSLPSTLHFQTPLIWVKSQYGEYF